MMFRVVAVLLFFLLRHGAGTLIAQPPSDTAGILRQLDFLYERDQITRGPGDSLPFQHYFDSCNLAYVARLIDTIGWPGKSYLGPRGNYIVFLIVQHADLAVQEKYFPLMEQSVSRGESRPQDLALLEDRIRMRQGRKQRYGSQVVFTQTGEQVFWPIEDEPHVNERRAKAGLEPLEEYALHFGIAYILPRE